MNHRDGEELGQKVDRSPIFLRILINLILKKLVKSYRRTDKFLRSVTSRAAKAKTSNLKNYCLKSPILFSKPLAISPKTIPPKVLMINSLKIFPINHQG